MELIRLGPVCGAEISGVDLGRLAEETFAAIRRALADHQVLVFKHQHINTDQQVAFGNRFGELLVHHFARIKREDLPELMVLDTTKERPDPLTDIWHSDETYRPAPPLATILRSKVLPPLGGDTMFASMTAAYDGLSSRMKDHYAPKDYFPQQRQMERVTIAGQAPIPAESGPPVEIPRVTVTDVDMPVPAQV